MEGVHKPSPFAKLVAFSCRGLADSACETACATRSIIREPRVWALLSSLIRSEPSTVQHPTCCCSRVPVTPQQDFRFKRTKAKNSNLYDIPNLHQSSGAYRLRFELTPGLVRLISFRMETEAFLAAYLLYRSQCLPVELPKQPTSRVMKVLLWTSLWLSWPRARGDFTVLQAFQGSHLHSVSKRSRATARTSSLPAQYLNCSSSAWY